jgi:antitoxin VapB
MGLNIKNERITALVRELAERTGLTQTGAVEEAVRSKLAELDQTDVGARRRRDLKHAEAQRIVEELHRSLTDAERAALTVVDDELYDDVGLPR